jgi:dUTP pyrophosphatase
MPLNLKIKLLADVKPPKKGSIEAAGLDLHAPVDCRVFCNMPPIMLDEDGAPSNVFPNGRIPLGFSSEFSAGYVGLIFPRSGLGSSQGLHPRNICGVIDSDYRGEWQVAARVDSEQHTGNYMKGVAMMQVIFLPIAEANEYLLEQQDGTSETYDAVAGAAVRGEGGFGSTTE